MNHEREFCQYGTLHKECRCPKGNVWGEKPVVTVVCPTPWTCVPTEDTTQAGPGVLLEAYTDRPEVTR